MASPDAGAPFKLSGQSHAAAGLAALNVLGGIAGSVISKKGSSAFAGVLLGSAFAYSAFLISSPGETERGLRLATVVSALQAGAMGRRAWVSRKPVPAALAAAGAVSLVYHARAWQQWA